MKFVALALLFVCVQCRPDGETAFPGLEHLDDLFNAGIDRALKRKHGDTYTATEADACARACIKDPPTELGTLLGKFKETPGLGNLKDLYNKERLTKICTHTNVTGACVRACPDGQRKDYMKKIFKPVKYMCAESNFVENAPCYHDVWEEMKDVCKSPEKCGPKKASFEEALAAYKAANPKTKEVIEGMVSKLCSGIDCALDCANDKRIEKCGADKNKVLRHFYHELEEAVKAARYMTPRETVSDWPAECEHIGHDA
jgi:hypothetical protein